MIDRASIRFNAGCPFAVVAAVTPCLALFSGPSPTTMFLLAVLGGVVATWRRRPWGFYPVPLLLVLGGLAVWSLISCFWSQTPVDRAMATTFAVAGLAVCGMLCLGAAATLEEGERRLVRAGLVLGVGVAVAVLLLEELAGYPVTRLFHGALMPNAAVSRGAVVVLLLLGPVVQCVRWPYALAVSLVAAAALVMTEKHAVILALGLAVSTFGLGLLAPGIMLRVWRWALVGVILTAPMVELTLPSPEDAARRNLFNSATHRLVVWEFAVARILEQPLRGWGMDSSRSIEGGDDTTVVSFGYTDRTYPHMPLHPHNGALQVWLELGLPGALLLSCLVWWVVGRIGSQPLLRREKALRAAAMAAAAAVGLLSYGLWQSWWQSTLWLLPVLFVATALPPGEDGPCAG